MSKIEKISQHNIPYATEEKINEIIDRLNSFSPEKQENLKKENMNNEHKKWCNSVSIGTWSICNCGLHNTPNNFIPPEKQEEKCCEKCHGYYLEPRHEYFPLCNDKTCPCHSPEKQEEKCTHNKSYVCQLCYKAKPTSWEEEFDNKFGPYCGFAPLSTYQADKIKDFLSQERQRAIEETVKKVELLVKNNKNAYMFPETQERFLSDLLDYLSKT